VVEDRAAMGASPAAAPVVGARMRVRLARDYYETTALNYSQAGRTRTLMLDTGQLAAVRRATERYRKARAKLDAEADAGLATLITTRGLARAGR